MAAFLVRRSSLGINPKDPMNWFITTSFITFINSHLQAEPSSISVFFPRLFQKHLSGQVSWVFCRPGVLLLHNQQVKTLKGTPTNQSIGLTVHYCVTVKMKSSHTRYQAMGPELIPVYRQLALRWREVNHAINLAVGCHYFLPSLWLPP